MEDLEFSAGKYKRNYDKVKTQRNELEQNIVHMRQEFQQLKMQASNENLVSQIQGHNDSPTTNTSRVQVTSANGSML